MRVVVLGGGLSGLTFAYAALADARRRGIVPPEIILLEASERLGGNVRTEREAGFLLDGPDGFVITRPYALELCEKLGLASRLIETIPENRRVYVVRRRELLPLPDDLVLGVPVRVSPILRSSLLSWRAKARLLADWLWPPWGGEPLGDPSIGEFIGRRLGKEMLEVAVEPLLGGIYAGDTQKLSLRATFPRLVEAATRSGSLLRGMRATHSAESARANNAANIEEAPRARSWQTNSARRGSRASPFRSLRGGMGELVDALAQRLTTEGASVRRSARALGVVREKGRFCIRLASDEVFEADRVIVGLPAHAAARVLERLDPILSAELSAIPYVSAAVVYLGYRRGQVAHPLDASGFLVPKREGLKILGTTFMSSKWEGRAPPGHVLLRTFIGGAHAEGVAELSDDALVAIARHELEPLIGIEGAPVLARIFRYPRSSPQPVVGHHARVARIEGLVAAYPGLTLIGNAYDGVGIPDAIRVATKSAAAMMAACDRAP